MQLQPRYDGEPAFVVEGVGDPSVALLRQRRRLLDMLTGLDDAGWSAPTRCEEWSVQGVVTHLTTTDQFWAFSIGSGLAGEPTRFLTTFDPVASPAQMVREQSALQPADVLERFTNAVDSLGAVVTGVAADQWETVRAEAPPGHIALNATAVHALWDGWIHERDILLPLGRTPAEEHDEIDLALRYVAGLGSALNATSNGGKVGTLGVVATDPDVSLVVDAGTTVRVRTGDAGDRPTLRGRAVDLIEALSYRAPLQHDLGPDDTWLVSGLGVVFDVGS